MKTGNINKVMSTLLAISVLTVLVGWLLKSWNYPVVGSIMGVVGIISYVFLSNMEIRRLKKIIAKLKWVVNPYELTIMSILRGISVLQILVGVFLILWHYPGLSPILRVGLFSYPFLSGLEIRRLKKIIAKSKRVVNPDELAV